MRQHCIPEESKTILIVSSRSPSGSVFIKTCGFFISLQSAYHPKGPTARPSNTSIEALRRQHGAVNAMPQPLTSNLQVPSPGFTSQLLLPQSQSAVTKDVGTLWPLRRRFCIAERAVPGTF